VGATDETAIWRETSQGLHILFGLTSIHFFAYDPGNNGLRGVTLPDVTKSSVIKELIVPMKMEESLLIECLQTRMITDSFSRSTDTAPGVLDKQIIRLSGKDGIICIPMVAYNEKVGVIVLGLDIMEFSSLGSQFKLLQMLADQAAVAIRVHHIGQSQSQQAQAKQLISASSMAENIVHKVNNPLIIIKNYVKSIVNKITRDNMSLDETKIIN
jgi:hypothetical protein